MEDLLNYPGFIATKGRKSNLRDWDNLGAWATITSSLKVTQIDVHGEKFMCEFQAMARMKGNQGT